MNIEVIDDNMVKVLKNKTPQERLKIAFNMWSSAKKQLTNYLMTQHPDWTEKKIKYEAVKRLSHGAV